MRADVYLVEHGYVGSRQRAQTLIAQGCVVIDGKTVTKAALPISDGEHEVSVTDDLRYVGRGGLKLEGALEAFSLDVKGMCAVDIGASTGGFTDCLLQHGAAKVYAIDAGEGQLAAKLVQDERVVSLERKNARELSLADVGGVRVDLIVMDVSFISATYILPRFAELLRPEGHAVCLIKPQFEVGRGMLGKGGIVKDPKAHQFAIDRVLEAGRQVGLTSLGVIPSPIAGGDGNKEFLVHFVLEANG